MQYPVDMPAQGVAIPASEHPNAAVIRHFYAALARADMASAQACFAADAVWHLPGRSPMAGDHRGWDAILTGLLGKLRELTDGTFRAELTDVLANDRQGVALQRATATRGSLHLDVTGCQVMRFRDGKITEVRGYYSDQYALDEFWS